MNITKSTCLALAFSVAAGTAGAAVITSQDFSTNPVLSDTQAPGAWYTDRYAPESFSSETFMGDERLAVTISEADNAAGRPSGQSNVFYNTQGRKFDITGATSLSIDFFIDSAFENAQGRIGGVWGAAVDGTNTITSYPIIEFFDNQFQVYTSDTASWMAVGTQTGFAYDSFANLEIAIDSANDLFSFSVDGEQLYSGAASGSLFFDTVILQNINTDAGVDRTIYFDNLVATSEMAPVPLPASLPLLLAGVGGLYALRRRKRT
ncbi:VPLPA-CTERM sorting domain-containing protein [Sedimentitalea arenosa]|nr:VPLPA-CTERM sorting domain-containing protein [Arenibacterium arenosum]